MVAEDRVRERRIVNDTAERGVALKQEFNALWQRMKNRLSLRYKSSESIESVTEIPKKKRFWKVLSLLANQNETN